MVEIYKGRGPTRLAASSRGILVSDVLGKHVHKLGRRIVSVEGFCRFRYQHGWAHEPNPLDVLEESRYTNRVAERDKLLAPVPSVPLLGSFAKTHMLSFLQALSKERLHLLGGQPGAHGAAAGSSDALGAPAVGDVL